MNCLIKKMFAILCLVPLFAGILFPAEGAAYEKKRVLILPFTIYSEKDLDFLRQGIRNMLQSRMSGTGKFVVINCTEIPNKIQDRLKKLAGENEALAIAKELSADYLVTGNMTFLGNNVSTSAKFVHVNSNEPLVIFNEIGGKQDDALLHVNQFTLLINDNISREVAVAEIPVKTVKQTSRTIIYSVPEEKISVKKMQRAVTAWKSIKLGFQIKGLATGDINGDNKTEVAVVNEKDVIIYRYDDGKLNRMSNYSGKKQHSIIGLDIADINKNGKAEIFVTAFHKKNYKIQSFIIEWDGKNFIKILEGQNWYYRVVDMQKKGKILLGQKKGFQEDPFQPGIHEISWDKGEYRSLKIPDIPPKVNVYGFSCGDVMNNGTNIIAFLKANGQLQILSPKGEKEWSSPTRKFGGGSNYIEIPSQEYSKDTELTKFYFLQQRLYIHDFDEDGKNEVITIRNNDTLNQRLLRSRNFQDGWIESLQWDDITGLQENWKTEELPGYLSDFTIGDINDDGKKELIYSVVYKADNLFGKKKSCIFMRNNLN